MGRRVRIAANYRHSGQTQAFLGTNHVDDAVILRHHTVVSQSELFGVLSQRVHLLLRYRIFNKFILIVRWRIVVGHAVNLLGAETFQSASPHTVESLRRCHLVAIQAVDVKLCGSVFYLLHHVLIPNRLLPAAPRAYPKSCRIVYSFVLLFKFIDTIDICFDRCCYDIGIGTKTIVQRTVVLHLHVHLTHIV